MTFKLLDADWDQVFADARRADSSAIRLVCPFVQRKPIERMLSHGKPRSIQVLTRFNLDDWYARVSDPSALSLLIEHGASIRGVKHLHAKMYLLGAGHSLVTSANLTNAGLTRNHEFGFSSDDPEVVAQCHEYFERLWGMAGTDLTLAQLQGWQRDIEQVRASSERGPTQLSLGDAGADAGLPDPSREKSDGSAAGVQAFVKLFGESDRRLELGYKVIDEVSRAGCHWACTYPKGKRPRAVKDGAIMYMGRLMRDPNDIRIFGRAVAKAHVEGRDDATREDIQQRGWKEKWPHYVRVEDAAFIEGTLGDGVSLYQLMDEMRAECFLPTQRNARAGQGNTNPRKAYLQQAAIELSMEGAAWVDKKLGEAFKRVGRLPQSVMDGLDWPSGHVNAPKGRP
jgi:hypothetical protein